MKAIFTLLLVLSGAAFAESRGSPTDIFKMRKEIQATADRIGNKGVNQERKNCRLNTFLDRKDGEDLLGITFRREDASTIYLFYSHQKFQVKKAKLPEGGVSTEFYKSGKLFLILESVPGKREKAHIESSGGHFQYCERSFR